jgi:hypothetical protein
MQSNDTTASPPKHVGSTAELSDGNAAHVAWESVRGPENEIDAERRIADEAEANGADMKQWWEGWLYRSDLWRDEIGHESDNTADDRR